MEGKAHRPFRNPAATFLTPLIAKICIRCPMLAQSRAPFRIVRPWQGQTGRCRPATRLPWASTLQDFQNL